LAQKVDELELHYVLRLETSDGALAETIRKTTASGDQTILTLNSMQAATTREIEQGISYLSLMEENLATLETALQN
jgi:zinc transport system substrate-binding protein